MPVPIVTISVSAGKGMDEVPMTRYLEEAPREMSVPETVRAGPEGVRVVPSRTIGEPGAKVTGWPAMVNTCAGTFGVRSVEVVVGNRVMALPPTSRTEFEGERETGVPEIVTAEPADRVVPSKTMGVSGHRVTGWPAKVINVSEDPPEMLEGTFPRVTVLPPTIRAEFDDARDI